MKNLISKSIILLSVALTLWGCGNSDEDNPTSSTISYNFEGTSVTSRATGEISIFIERDDSTVAQVFETFFGGLDVGLVFLVPSIDNLLGSYTLSDDNMILLLDDTSGGATLLTSSNCSSKTGRIIITEYDPDQRWLTGSFEGQICTGGGIVQSISGTFDRVRYITQIQVF